MPRVAVVKTTDPYDAYQALDLISAKGLFEQGESILLKPNCVKPQRGVNTSAQVVQCVISYLEMHGHANLIVGDGGIASYDTWETFRLTGLNEVARGKPLVDLNEDPRVHVDTGGKLGRIGVAETFYEADAIVSIPKLKVHCLAGATLGMKNMMGGILPKNIMHTDIHQKIVDLNKSFRPRLTIVDGIIGVEGHETGGDPVEHGVIVAGEDMVAVDTVCTYMMGLPTPQYLQLAEEEGLGTCSLDDIEIVGDEPVVKNYRH